MNRVKVLLSLLFLAGSALGAAFGQFCSHGHSFGYSADHFRGLPVHEKFQYRHAIEGAGVAGELEAIRICAQGRGD